MEEIKHESFKEALMHSTGDLGLFSIYLHKDGTEWLICNGENWTEY